MDRISEFFSSLFGRLTIRTIIAIVVALSFFFGIYYGTSRDYKALCDAFGVGGAVVLGMGIFSWINNLGFFDFASYGFASAFSALKKDFVKPYDDLVDYKEKKAYKRKADKWNWVPYVIVGLIFIILFIVVDNVYYIPSLPKAESSSSSIFLM